MLVKEEKMRAICLRANKFAQERQKAQKPRQGKAPAKDGMDAFERDSSPVHVSDEDMY